MFKLTLLSFVLLFSQGIQDVMSYPIFVSRHGHDLDNCGNRSAPCRSVRQAVKISYDGDQIYIDYAEGKPYMECENVMESTCSIKLAKSVSFYGNNGRAEIQCRRCHTFFTITSSSFQKTRIQFVNLNISSSNIVTRLVQARAELIFHNTLVTDNFYGIYSKLSSDCFIEISNSSFQYHSNGAIRVKCFNISARISFSTFKTNSVLFTSIRNEHSRWQKTEILVQGTVFDGESIPRCGDMLEIQPFAAIFNVTITDSDFKNHVVICKNKHQYSALHVKDHHSNPRNTTIISLRNLLIENNYNSHTALSLRAGYLDHSLVKMVIRDSIFKNNSAALSVSISNFDIGTKINPTIHLKNNTFVENFYLSAKPFGAAAIFFNDGRSLLTSCRFLDNKAGINLYSGVVTISGNAVVKFLNCYFQNEQTDSESTQLFSSGVHPLRFKGKNTFNLVALKREQFVFVRIPTTMKNGVFIKKNFKIVCPHGYKLNLQQQCVAYRDWNICQYLYVQCQQCPTKTYTLERGKLVFNKTNDIQCKHCPRGGDCDSGLVTAKPNFWGYKNEKKVSFIHCPPGYCCESESCVTYNDCHGRRSGTLCGQCPEGMSESLFSAQCISNRECSITYFFSLGTVAMLVVYLLFFLYHREIIHFLRSTLFSRRLLFSINGKNELRSNSTIDGNASSGSGMIKIFFYYYQVCHLLRSPVTSSKESKVIDNLENVISRAMNMILLNVPSFKCPLKNLRAVPKAVVLHSVGFCLLCLLCLLYLVSRLFLFLKRVTGRSDRRIALESVTTSRSVQENIATKTSLSQRIASAFTYISLLMYASSAQLCLSLLHCVPVGESQVLFLDGSIKCYQTFQYFLLAYLISSILPFCLVPVLGSYLLKFGRIGVKQFCVASIFPLPFCCYWMYLLAKDCRGGNQGTYKTVEQNNDALTNEEYTNETQGHSIEETSFATDEKETSSRCSQTAILNVLSGPFRSHQPFFCFPSSHIPWEGCLIVRRLVFIIVLTFVYDIQFRLFLALTTCVAILLFHMFVAPFQTKRDNVLESFSLSSHVVLCGLTLIKVLYYGEDYSSFSDSLPVLNVIENILIVAPLSIIIIAVIMCMVIKLVFGLLFFVSFLIRKIRRLAMN